VAAWPWDCKRRVRSSLAWRIVDETWGLWSIPSYVCSLDSGGGIFLTDFSPNGRFIAYQSDESGRYAIYVRPFPRIDNGRWQVRRRAAHAPCGRGAAVDEQRKASTTIVDALRNYDIVPVAWSTRDAVRKQLAA
jgi:hypothetical protein